jgi:hypothetical protein
MGINNQLAKSIASGAGVSTALNTARVLFSSAEKDFDWRVKLSLPQTDVFTKSAVLAPLRATKGVVFPFTPTINISSTANYSDIPVVHQNFQFSAYQNSKTSDIDITGEFIVEDSVQAQYWVAVLHYLKSITKMFSGNDQNAGNPPPIVHLNGYGDYVFNNVPVIVKTFNVVLANDVDYIETTVGNNLGALSTSLDTASDIFGLTGASTALLDKASTAVNVAAGAIGKVTSIFDKSSGTSSGLTRVPVRSTISITVSPVYSKTEAREFSLQKFVSGEYAKQGRGYL